MMGVLDNQLFMHFPQTAEQYANERLFANLHHVNYRSTPEMTSNTRTIKGLQQGAAKNFK